MTIWNREPNGEGGVGIITTNRHIHALAGLELEPKYVGPEDDAIFM